MLVHLPCWCINHAGPRALHASHCFAEFAGCVIGNVQQALAGAVMGQSPPTPALSMHMS